jgi:hypothetical protein
VSHAVVRTLALVVALLCTSCGGPDRPATGPTGPTGSATPAGSGADPHVAVIEGLLAPVEAEHRDEAAALAAELAADWLREAAGDKDADAILALLRDELAAKLAGRSSGDQLEIVRAQVYDRRARALGRRSLALGKAVIDGAVTDAEARARGEQILHELAPLAARVRALRDPEVVRVLARDLEEVGLEATYAIERGAMSRRLSDYQAEKGAPGTPR